MTSYIKQLQKLKIVLYIMYACMISLTSTKVTILLYPGEEGCLNVEGYSAAMPASSRNSVYLARKLALHYAVATMSIFIHFRDFHIVNIYALKIQGYLT